ncbi:MAG: hypothetical protein OHK93_004282 [Ramalina farinacea]|uniref:Uncharacterized protein n=1 Tax=Ramalina farinacea TaxID=258253 RepID=A0AA43TVU2_9LECA|nr:hypothetical protein [Ramalina farinacea]
MTLKTTAPPAPPPSSTPPSPVSLLILGAGWTSIFLLPLLTTNKITHAATTRSGSSTTIPFTFSPDSTDTKPYTLLPAASTILITFPLKGSAAAHQIVNLYNTTHPSSQPRRWILLGSTGIWSGDGWHSESSPYDTSAPRAQAEDALLALSSPSSPSSPTTTATILNLSGLYDNAARRPRDWLARVATSKSQLRDKGAVHLVHGRDVARCVVLSSEKREAAFRRQRVEDERC